MSVTLANGGAVDRSTTDFYPTPWEATDALLRNLRLPAGTRIWEPAAGEGHMVDVMEKWGYEVSASDLFSYTNENFLDIKELRGDWIITNPPFKHAEAFLRHALELQPQGFAMLLKSQYWHAAGRYSLFEELRPCAVLPLTWRPDFLFGKKGSAPTMEVLWTVWADSMRGAPTRYFPLQKPTVMGKAPAPSSSAPSIHLSKSTDTGTLIEKYEYIPGDRHCVPADQTVGFGNQTKE